MLFLLILLLLMVSGILYWFWRKRENSLLDDAFTMVPYAIIIVDAQKTILRINPAACALKGIQPEAARGQHIDTLFPMLKTLDDRRIVETFCAEQGAMRQLQVEQSFIRDGSVQLIIMRDVTDIRQTLQKLHESETRYNLVMNTMVKGVVLQTAEGVIQACNPAAERILGLTADQMMGLSSVDPSWRSIHPDYSPFPGETHPAMVTLQTGEAQYDVIMGVYKPDDSLTWIEISSIPIQDLDETKPHAVLVTFVDITERIEANKQALEIALEKERVDLLASFFSDAAHEFRTPLATINSSAYLLQHTADSVKRAEKIKNIQDAVERVTYIVDMIVKMTRLEYTALQFEPLDLPALLEDARRNEALPDRITVTIPPDVPLIRADGKRIRDVLTVLLDNASRYSPVGAPIQLEVTHTADTLTIAVRDQGDGIEPEQHEHIFEMFWRGDSAHTTPGLGLGLPLARRIVEMHGGTLTLKSKLGVGSCFCINLPLNAVTP